ncbi:MAG TPA: ATP-binding protein, partial [Dehalococcoidia bacterium]|nr:ATP-binding protein [Dehalococcoidia bacterium]
ADTSPPKGVLLTGPSGTGKTLLAKAVAHECGVNFISIKGPELLSKWVGDSEARVRDVFKIARLSSPCIIFFDELEAIAGRRGGGQDGNVTERVISQMLTEMDGIEELRGVVILAATSRPDLLDPSLLRAGRFEVRLELPLPTGPDREAIFGVHTVNKPLSEDVDAAKLASITDGFVGSDIEAVCRRASMMAISEFLDGGDADRDASSLTITQAHFLSSIESIRKLHEMKPETPADAIPPA